MKALFYVAMNCLLIQYSHLLFKGLAFLNTLQSVIRLLFSVSMAWPLLGFNIFEGSIEVPQMGILASGLRLLKAKLQIHVRGSLRFFWSRYLRGQGR